jgi:adenylate kinase family enzyme
MKVIIINSAPGVGKSTLLKELEKSLSNGYAIVDGDDFARTIPLISTVKWLNLMQDNIASCAKNYFEYNIKILIISFVFPTFKRLQRLIDLLNKVGCSVTHLRLVCEDDELKMRITNRNTQRAVSIDRAIELNRNIIELTSDYTIDTTSKTPEEVAQMVKVKIEKLKDDVNE